MQPGKTRFIQNRKESAPIWRILSMQVYRWQATLCAYYLWLREKLLGWEFAIYQKFLTSGFGEQFIIFWQIEWAMKVTMGLHLRGHRFWNNRESKIERPNWKYSRLCWIEETSRYRPFCFPRGKFHQRTPTRKLWDQTQYKFFSHHWPRVQNESIIKDS